MPASSRAEARLDALQGRLHLLQLQGQHDTEHVGHPVRLQLLQQARSPARLPLCGLQSDTKVKTLHASLTSIQHAQPAPLLPFEANGSWVRFDGEKPGLPASLRPALCASSCLLRMCMQPEIVHTRLQVEQL